MAWTEIPTAHPSLRWRTKPLNFMYVPHIVAQMGDRLRREVERQLLLDLEHYRSGSADEKLTIDWANPSQEGHCTDFLGGSLESMSDVVVRRSDGKTVADGWIDFVHGGGDHLPLFVFWLFLDLVDDEGRSVDVKQDNTIPPLAPAITRRCGQYWTDGCLAPGLLCLFRE